MRVRVASPVLAALLTAGGLAVMSASSSHASSVKLYFHSAGGGYLNDWQADPQIPLDDAAPAGSTLDAKAPTKTTDARAQSTFPNRSSGYPLQPTFSLPFTGDVTTVCVDLWVQSSDSGVTGMTFTPMFDIGTAAALEDVAVPAGSGLTRVTKLVKPAANAPKITVPKDSEFIVAGYMVNDPDFTLVYDSVAHPSSITLNATECKAAPVVVPSGGATPAPGGSATPTPGGSATPTPGGSATPTPGGSATPTPGGSATPTAAPSLSPTPSPTPPPPARETTLDYTGATSARHSDAALVSARVALPDGSPVPTGSVDFTLGGVTARFPVNGSGVASGRMPVRAAAGDHIMTVTYVANSAFLGTREQVPFSVSRMPTRCAISRTTSGSGWVVTGTLRDAAGRAVAGQSLLFSYNGRTWKAVRTDRTGRASVTVPANRGTYGVALPANAYYTGCSASFRI